MEDVSKALLMAGGILLAILVMTIGAIFFSSASDLMESFKKSEEASVASQFNNKFTKFIGSRTDDNSVKGYATIHDIVSLANFAWDYNNRQVYELTKMDLTEQLEDTRIIHINITNGIARKNRNTIEVVNGGTYILSELQNYNQDAYQILLSELYFQSNESPNTKSIINFQIDVKKVNAEGKIINVDFYPATIKGKSNITAKEEISNVNTRINDIKNKLSDSKYKKFNF